MKKIFRVVLVIGLLSFAVAGITILIRNNSNNNSMAYSMNNSGGGNGEIPAQQIYIEKETIYF